MTRFSTAKIVQQVRKALGLTQPELAAELGVSYSALQKYEAGTNQPRPRTLRRLAEIAPPELAAQLGMRHTPGPPAQTDLAKRVDDLEARIEVVEERLRLPEKRRTTEALVVEDRASPKRKSGTSPAGGVTNHLTGT